MGAFIDNSLRHHLARGRTMDCAYIQWLLAQLGRPCFEVRTEAVERPDWFAVYGVAGIELTLDLQGEERDRTHRLYATKIVAEPRDVPWRIFVLKLTRENADRISPEALALLQEWLDAG